MALQLALHCGVTRINPTNSLDSVYETELDRGALGLVSEHGAYG